MFHRHLRLKMTLESSSPLVPHDLPSPLDFPVFTHTLSLLVTQAQNPVVICNSSLSIISYSALVTESCQFYLLNSFLPLPPCLYDPGSHLGLFVTKQ